MKSFKFKGVLTVLLASAVLTGCATATDPKPSNPAVQETATKGTQYTDILSATSWQGTIVYDKDNNDLTEENEGFIGLAKYDGATGFYEFFDKETTETRGDEGIFFITNDGEKRILISQTKGYQAVVDLVELDETIFTYKRMGKDKEDNDIEVYVEHIPYNGSTLTFTNAPSTTTVKNDKIEQSVPGTTILAETLWNGTVVLDEDGNDVTAENAMFISIAKFDEQTNKYEFFNLETGVSRGDFGFFDVINNEKRVHVSIGENRYGAALTLTELNSDRFTYERMGKDKDGNDIKVYVEHEPYLGEYKPEFSF